MPDWREVVSGRLGNFRLEPVRAEVIVEELAAYLEDCYREALSAGATAKPNAGR